jgi:proton-dependent oligopeptide transporter, POT family
LATASEATSPRDDVSFFGHPRGLSTLFFTEMWERYTYYGIRGILILFMTAPLAAGGMGFDTPTAGAVYGTYVSFVYLMSLPGGWLADRFLGQRRATLYGGVVIMLGNICLAVPSPQLFYPGLALVILGTGLLKPNVSVMVGQLYSEKDTRRDAGFSIFYMGINTGAFLAPLVCGWFAQQERFKQILISVGIRPETSWHWGFGAAAAGMFLGLVQYLAGWKYLGDIGMNPAPPKDAEDAAGARRTLRNGILAVAGVVALMFGLHTSGIVEFTPTRVSNAFGVMLFLTAIIFFVWLFLAGNWTKAERKSLVVITVLFFGAAVFWSVFEQAGSTLNLFADRNTANTLLGLPFPAAWYQSLNSLFIMALAPVFAALWIRLGDRNPSSPAKFTIGLLFVALGFGILIVAAGLAAGGTKVSPLWLTATYLLHTVGELCLSPVGLAAMTRLAPVRVVSLMMGVWFLATSVGNYIGGRIGGFYESFSLPTLFTAVTVFALVATAVMAALVKPIRRMLAEE